MSKKDESEIKGLIKMLEEKEGDSSLESMLEERGRSCISRALLKRAKEATKGARTAEESLEKLASVVPYLKREKGKIYMVYPRCFCHKIKMYRGKVPESYCNCSVGWVKELFWHAMGNPVKVTLESSVLRGDGECRFRVYL